MFPIRKSEIPIVVLLLPFMAGIVLGLYFNNAITSQYLVTGITITTFSFLLLNLTYSRLSVYRFSWLGGTLLHMSLLLAGWLCLAMSLQINQPRHFSKIKADYLLVKVITEARQSAQYFRIIAEAENSIRNNKTQKVTGRLLITIVADSNSHPVTYGDQLLIAANYKTVDAPFNPAEFNYKQYLAHQNIYHQSFLTTRQFVKTAVKQGNPVVAYALQLRQQMVEAFKGHLHAAEAAAVASTLVLGYKADLSTEIVQAYSKTGTIHVLSVSGAHVAVIFWFITLMFKPLSRHRYGKWLSAVLSLLLIWGYALLTGFSPAVCRAALMISMLIISRASHRQVHALNMLAVSAFALLLYNPLLITDVGFQLSYLAVLGLIVIQPVLAHLVRTKNKWIKKLWYLCSASLAAQIITFPLSAYYFHQFPVYFLISNLFIILPSELIMGAGMLFLLLHQVPYINTLLAVILENAILLMNRVLSFIEHLPGASISKIWITPAEHLLLYALIILSFSYLIYKKGWYLVTGLLALLVLSVSVSFKTIRNRSADHLVFLNLKKHTGILLQSGPEAIVITDLNSKDKAYQYSIQPCLDSLQVESVNTIGLRENRQTAFMHKQLNLVQYKNKTLLLFDEYLQDVRLAKKLKVDYLFVTGSPHAGLDFICKNYTFGALIVDADNSAQRVDQLMNDARQMKIKIFCLKRNKALTLASN